jgi:putative FmdB family regulatory protein
VPIYEYRCPNGHTFEQFRRMNDPRPDACEVCAEGPLEIVLYPVAVHYKGSGFYSTDYGRGSRKPKDGGESSGDGGGGGEKSGDKSGEKSGGEKKGDAPKAADSS